MNAASLAPFTAAIVPGEFLTLYGTGMAPSGFSAAATIPYPIRLGGVQVMIGRIAAPIDFVSPGRSRRLCLTVSPVGLSPSR